MKLITPLLLTSTISALAATEYSNRLFVTHYLSEDPDDNITELFVDLPNVEENYRTKKGVKYESVYELFATNKANISDEYLLDTKTVYTKGPSASISITSADPYTKIPRTRADKPFYVTHTVDLNLERLTDEELLIDRYNSVVIDYAYRNPGEKWVNKGDTYTIIDEEVEDPETNEHWPKNILPDITNIKNNAVIQFSINENVTKDADEFASQSVRILPKHDGGLDIEDGSEWQTLPTLTVTVTNLYPQTTAYLVAFPKGKEGQAAVVPESQIPNPSSSDVYTPNPITNSHLKEVITEGGDWIIQLRVNTPWGNELIEQKEITKLSTLRINANNITTSE